MLICLAWCKHFNYLLPHFFCTAQVRTSDTQFRYAFESAAGIPLSPNPLQAPQPLQFRSIQVRQGAPSEHPMSQSLLPSSRIHLLKLIPYEIAVSMRISAFLLNKKNIKKTKCFNIIHIISSKYRFLMFDTAN